MQDRVVAMQTRNQLGTPGRPKSFLRVAQIFRLCPILSNNVQHSFPGRVKIFVGVYAALPPLGYELGCLPRKYRLAVDLITCSLRKLLFYSNSNHIFLEPNKHKPFSGHRAYLCRFEVVVFQPIQNMAF